MADITQTVATGLSKVDLLPVGGGYVDFLGGYASARGAYARGEAGWHPAAGLDTFAFLEASSGLGVDGGAGLRWRF